jgi:hypothetical protein
MYALAALCVWAAAVAALLGAPGVDAEGAGTELKIVAPA